MHTEHHAHQGKNVSDVSDIEDYLQGGTQNVMHIKVGMLVT